MSLDISLYEKRFVKKKNTSVFVRENGNIRELTFNELKNKFPNLEVLEGKYILDEVYESNITHNLSTMANKAGIYKALWRPEEIYAKYAKDIISIVEKGLDDLKRRPEYFKQFSSPNGWGMYKNFVPFVAEYLEACKEYPAAEIYINR